MLFRSVPVTDVFFFLTYMAFALADATQTPRQVEAFSAAFFGPHAWARRHVMNYAQALGVPWTRPEQALGLA